MSRLSDDSGRLDGIQEFLSSLRKRGVVLWTEDGTLRYRARKGAVNADDLKVLHRANSLISLLLSSATVPSESAETPRPYSYRAPLSFTQLAHWNRRREANGMAVRQIASATRLLGRLSGDALASSIGEVVRRQWALRTRIVAVNGVPMQEITEGNARLEVIDLNTIAEQSRETEIQRHIERAVLEAGDYASAPLFRALLLKVRERESVLILALDHIISDGVSLNILFEQIFTAYVQCLRGDAIELPAIAMQFSEYATRQRAESGRLLETYKAGWHSHRRTRFPPEPRLEAGRHHLGWGKARVLIDMSLWESVRAWAKSYRTTPVLTVLTAYAALTLRWCNVAETVIQFMSDGRTIREIEHTIGYFAFPLYLNVMAKPRDRFVDLLETLVAEYCRASDQPDFSYAHAQEPRPEFTYNTVFNWLYSGGNQLPSVLDGSERSLTCSRIKFEPPSLRSLHLDLEPSVLVSGTGDGLLAEVGYARNQFSSQTMERFAGNLRLFLGVLVRTPAALVSEIEIT